MFGVRTAAPLVVLLLLGAASPPAAEPVAGRVVAIEDETELRLSDQGTVRLAGVHVPAALAGAARAALAGLVLDREIRLIDPSRDRWGRSVAQVERADGLWLQGALLERGLAVVRPEPPQGGARLERMQAAEREARQDGRGAWARSGLVRAADRPDRLEPGFAIVRGEVRELARTRYAVYLNFGAPWWQDFTLKVGTGAAEAVFEEAGVPLEGLPGRTVEARGFVVQAGGPLIELFHPAQIEVHR